MKRWATAAAHDHLAHPHAINEAQAMEGHGYEQVDLPDLADHEDVMLLEGNAGSVAPARYHRQGQNVDHLGNRDQHVFEIWPGSEHSDVLPYAKTMRKTLAGEQVPRIAIFRASKPEHSRHGLPLYVARGRMS